MISPSCTKSDRTPITIDDFPDNWSFGNGVSVAVLVPGVTIGEERLSWAIFPDANAAAVRANYDTLRLIMEE